MDKEAYRLKRVKQERINNFIKLGFLLCAAFYVISSQTDLLNDFHPIRQSEYRVSCTSAFCAMWNPRTSKAKILKDGGFSNSSWKSWNDDLWKF